MSKRRVSLPHRKQRAILTDMLPFEVPPTFSNRGFYRFLRDNNVEIENGELRWIGNTKALDLTIRLIFGIETKYINDIVSQLVREWGRQKTRRAIPIKKCKMDTIPFNFRIAHNIEGRVLSVVHPRNQVQVASFYTSHSSLIIYYTSRSEFSIRHPVSVTRFSFFKDKLHEQRLDAVAGVEEDDREYEQLGSYFVYRKYRNIHRFFESYEYHNSERKYDAMVQIDVSKCFDSIYTHSLPWAILGKDQTKFKLTESKGTFGGQFDALMQNLNHKETNGIVIGPEFSRIFAEVILQSVDIDLIKKLKEIENLTHQVDYEIFRYVDDFFVFYNKESIHLRILDSLQQILKSKKLSINTAKIKHYKKPIITEITIAKDRISELLNAEIEPVCLEEPIVDTTQPVKRIIACKINASRLITRYKAAIKEADVTYDDLLNYTFAILESKLLRLLEAYLASDKSFGDRKIFCHALLAIMEFAFFTYSASPKVNITIRICRMITTFVNFMRAQNFPCEQKHLLHKYIHDNIMQQIEKNKVSNFREVETLYLLICLSQIGREYWLPVPVILRHFLIEEEKSTGKYIRPSGFLNYFSITTLLSYIKDKARYAKLRAFIEEHVISKLDFIKANCPRDAEAIMLLLDLIVCPYISSSTKEDIGRKFDLDPSDVAAVQSTNDYWFTAWGDKFQLGKELDAKHSREVY